MLTCMECLALGGIGLREWRRRNYSEGESGRCRRWCRRTRTRARSGLLDRRIGKSRANGFQSTMRSGENPYRTAYQGFTARPLHEPLHGNTSSAGDKRKKVFPAQPAIGAKAPVAGAHRRKTAAPGMPGRMLHRTARARVGWRTGPS